MIFLVLEIFKGNTRGRNSEEKQKERINERKKNIFKSIDFFYMLYQTLFSYFSSST